MSCPCVHNAVAEPCQVSPPSSSSAPGPARLQPLDQRGQVREAADLAVATRRCSKSRWVKACASGDAAAMPAACSRCSPTRCGRRPCIVADAEVDARLAKVDRHQLRVAVGEVQQRHRAGTLEGRRHVVQRRWPRRVGVGIARQRVMPAADGRGQHLQELAFAQAHVRASRTGPPRSDAGVGARPRSLIDRRLRVEQQRHQVPQLVFVEQAGMWPKRGMFGAGRCRPCCSTACPRCIGRSAPTPASATSLTPRSLP